MRSHESYLRQGGLPTERTWRLGLQDSTVTEQSVSDADVVAGIRTGNSALYGLVVQRYDRLLSRKVGGLLRWSEETTDVLQEAHFQAFTHIADFRGQANLSSWLTSIAVNEARSCLRRRSRLLERSLVRDGSDDIIAHASASSPSPERQAMHWELGRALREAVGKLPPRYREVFVLREIEELSTADVGKRLGLPAATVKTRLCRARRVLRTRLSAWRNPPQPLRSIPAAVSA
jgi:RNA polymerase sigma-70 factor, ECF subfamily